MQTISRHTPYDRATEDRLLAASGWEDDGYRLFDISTFASAAAKGWFDLPAETNALFLTAAHWRELGGYDQVYTEPGGWLANCEMWMRACREIEKAYRQWGSPLDRMKAVPFPIQVTHIYSQPLSEDYRKFQLDFSAKNPWFQPVHIKGRTHFPTLESPGPVADAIRGFYAAS